MYPSTFTHIHPTPPTLTHIHLPTPLIHMHTYQRTHPTYSPTSTHINTHPPTHTQIHPLIPTNIPTQISIHPHPYSHKHPSTPTTFTHTSIYPHPHSHTHPSTPHIHRPAPTHIHTNITPKRWPFICFHPQVITGCRVSTFTATLTSASKRQHASGLCSARTLRCIWRIGTNSLFVFYVFISYIFIYMFMYSLVYFFIYLFVLCVSID